MKQSIDSAIEVLQASKEGKEIHVFDTHKQEWKELIVPDFNFDLYEYRVKPVSEYAPWDFNSILIGLVVTDKVSGQKFMIIGQSESSVLIGSTWVDYWLLLEQFHKAGEPCGKLKSQSNE